MMSLEATSDRTDRIAYAISDELDRQARGGAARIDVGAMAEAVDRAIDGTATDATPREQMRQAKTPEQLNATNDG